MAKRLTRPVIGLAATSRPALLSVRKKLSFGLHASLADGVSGVTCLPLFPLVVSPAAVSLSVPFCLNHVCSQDDCKTARVRRSHRPGRAAAATVDGHQAVRFQQRRRRQIG